VTPDCPIEARALAAARRACARFGVRLDYEDFQDTVQAAAEGFWRAWQRRPGEIGYAVISARNAAVKFLIRDLWGSNPFAADEKELCNAIATEPRTRGLPDDVLRTLQDIFLSSRTKRGRRGQLAAARETFICNALAREWSPDGIAHALATSGDQIKKCRQHIRTVLAQELKRRPE